MKTELCAGTASAVRIARELGLDRVELCEVLEIGGVTPSIGFQQFSAAQIETHVLIRPRGGGFVFSGDEKDIMLRDIAATRETGVHGVVVGALNENGKLDTDWLRQVAESAGKLVLTFHRAFDEVQDWRKSMEILIGLGFTRILTSGQASSVWEGRETLKEMKSHAAGRIEIMAGGGIVAGDVQGIRELIQPDAIHFSGTKLRKLDANSRYAVDALLPEISVIREILSGIRK